MNTPDNNPYRDTSPANAKPLVPDQGSMLVGFFIGWGLIIGIIVITIFIVSVMINIAEAMSGGNSVIYQISGLVSFLIPIVFIVAAMIWFGKKGKSKIVKGIGAAIISLIALAILLVAACFGILSSGGWH